MLTTFIVGVLSGFMENWSITTETFNPNKFAETFFYYEPVLTLFTQWLLMKEAVIFIFTIDGLRRIAKRLKNVGGRGY